MVYMYSSACNHWKRAIATMLRRQFDLKRNGFICRSFLLANLIGAPVEVAPVTALNYQQRLRQRQQSSALVAELLV